MSTAVTYGIATAWAALAEASTPKRPKDCAMRKSILRQSCPGQTAAYRCDAARRRGPRENPRRRADRRRLRPARGATAPARVRRRESAERKLRRGQGVRAIGVVLARPRGPDIGGCGTMGARSRTAPGERNWVSGRPSLVLFFPRGYRFDDTLCNRNCLSMGVRTHPLFPPGAAVRLSSKEGRTKCMEGRRLTS